MGLSQHRLSVYVVTEMVLFGVFHGVFLLNDVIVETLFIHPR